MCLTSALGWLLLCSLPRPRNESINGHGLPSHHVFTAIRFSIRRGSEINSCLLSLDGILHVSLGFGSFFRLRGFCLDGILVFNGRVSKFTEALGYTLR